MATAREVEAALEEACRTEYGRIVSVLTRVLGSIDAAEDVLQTGFSRALRVWPERGIPSNPAAWLTTVSRRIAIDTIRQRKRRQAASDRVVAEHRAGFDAVNDRTSNGVDPFELIDQWPDERLRLIFTCCHPVLDPNARVALTLKEVCGITTAGIAGAFLIRESTAAQRLVRAKRRLRENEVRFEVPERNELYDRLEDVRRVIHLVFSEGYLPRHGERLTRLDLCEEAIRLARVLIELTNEIDAPASRAENLGLLAELIFTNSRRHARTDSEGRPILLEDQDRSLWIREEAAEAQSLLDLALEYESPGPHQIKAAIASLHHEERDTPDWDQIARLYATLYRYEPTEIVRLNQAVARGFASGPEAALKLLSRINAGGEMGDYPYFHLAQARFLEEAGRYEAAWESLGLARAASRNGSEQRFIDEQIKTIQTRRREQPTAGSVHPPE